MIEPTVEHVMTTLQLQEFVDRYKQATRPCILAIQDYIREKLRPHVPDDTIITLNNTNVLIATPPSTDLYQQTRTCYPVPDWVTWFIDHDVEPAWVFHAQAAYEDPSKRSPAFIRYDASDNLIVILPHRTPVIEPGNPNNARAYIDSHRKRDRLEQAYGTNTDQHLKDIHIPTIIEQTRPADILRDPDEIRYALRQTAQIGIFIEPHEPPEHEPTDT